MRLGPFRLEEALGKGGMGEVWRGRHVAQQIPVAIKVIASELANNERFRHAFADEVRAVARLDHPGVVAVYDHGVIDSAAARSSQGKLLSGSPYLVMELCTGRSLRGVRTAAGWPELRSYLLQLLDALAHAHARNVIHRDIKPGNVMVSIDEQGDVVLKLTDFGIARAADEGPLRDLGTSSGTGTPGYMAPEQIVGDLASQGPWTDLYAVGCIAYRLAAGHIPYALAGDDNAVLAAHLRDPVPPLHAQFPIPDGLPGWIEKLLAKNPYRRYVRAADAIWALLGLGDAMPDDDPSGIYEYDAAAMPSAPPTAVTLTTLGALDWDEPGDDIVDDPSTAPLPGMGDAPPIPPGYRRVERPSHRKQLLGAGLGLYGLRPIPMVGRHSERDRIWKQLREVSVSGRPALVLLHGISGNGKSRVAEWIAERAHELGAATLLRAVHGPVPSTTAGLSSMLARHFGCTGMGRAETLAHIRTVLGELPPYGQLSPALTELVVAPETERTGPSGQGRVRFTTMAERYAAIAHLVQHVSLARPVVMWLDDVQWGADALGLAEHLLDSPGEMRLLLLLTARDEVLDQRPLEAARIHRLLAHPRSQSLTIGPLPAQEHRQLVQQLLGLEGDLARRLDERTAGNPLFAVQLVGDWVRRGVLQPTDRGFQLRPGELAPLPDDIFALWDSRIDAVVQGYPDPEVTREALEVAAALGEDVDEQEWAPACRLCALVIPRGLEGRILETGLGRRREWGWSFCHGMLREALRRSADARGRGDRHHLACVAMLRALRPDLPDTPERVGHHLRAAGDHEAALEPLLEAARQRLERGDFDRIENLMNERREAMRSIGLSESDPRWVAGHLLHAKALLTQGNYDAAEEPLTASEHHARIPAQAAELRRLRAEALWQAGKMRKAIVVAHEARRQFEALGDPLGAADCRRIAAVCHLEGTGDHGAALREARAARRAYVEAGDLDRLADCDYLEGKVLVELGDPAAGREAVLAARRRHRSEGQRYGLAKCANALGEISRLRGELDEAERWYVRAYDMFESMGSPSGTVPRLNLALILVKRGDFIRATNVFRALQPAFLAAGTVRAYGFVDYGLAVCLAQQGDWAEFDRHLEAAEEWVPDRGRVDKDYAGLAELAGDHALEHGERGRAAKAYALAAAHWRALGRGDHADALLSRAR